MWPIFLVAVLCPEVNAEGMGPDSTTVTCDMAVSTLLATTTSTEMLNDTISGVTLC